MVLVTDIERKDVLKIFSDLYAAPDYDAMVAHMPVFTNDPDGELFAEYFDFLQSLYATRDHIKEFEFESQLDMKVHRLKREAEKFGYPQNLLEVFDG